MTQKQRFKKVAAAAQILIADIGVGHICSALSRVDPLLKHPFGDFYQKYLGDCWYNDEDWSHECDTGKHLNARLMALAFFAVISPEDLL